MRMTREERYSARWARRAKRGRAKEEEVNNSVPRTTIAAHISMRSVLMGGYWAQRYGEIHQGMEIWGHIQTHAETFVRLCAYGKCRVLCVPICLYGIRVDKNVTADALNVHVTVPFKCHWNKRRWTQPRYMWQRVCQQGSPFMSRMHHGLDTHVARRITRTQSRSDSLGLWGLPHV